MTPTFIRSCFVVYLLMALCAVPTFSALAQSPPVTPPPHGEQGSNDTPTGYTASVGGLIGSPLDAFFFRANGLMLAVINRLSVIADKAQTRIEKLEREGADVSTALVLLGESQADIDQTAFAVEAFGSAASSASLLNDRMEAHTKTQEAAVAARMAIHESYKALSATIKELRRVASQESEATVPPTETSGDTMEAL